MGGHHTGIVESVRPAVSQAPARRAAQVIDVGGETTSEFRARSIEHREHAVEGELPRRDRPAQVHQEFQARTPEVTRPSTPPPASPHRETPSAPTASVAKPATPAPVSTVEGVVPMHQVQFLRGGNAPQYSHFHRGQQSRAQAEFQRLPVDEAQARSTVAKLFSQAVIAEQAHEAARSDPAAKAARTAWIITVVSDVCKAVGINPQGVENDNNRNALMAKIRTQLGFLFIGHESEIPTQQPKMLNFAVPKGVRRA